MPLYKMPRNPRSRGSFPSRNRNVKVRIICKTISIVMYVRASLAPRLENTYIRARIPASVQPGSETFSLPSLSLEELKLSAHMCSFSRTHTHTRAYVYARENTCARMLVKSPSTNRITEISEATQIAAHRLAGADDDSRCARARQRRFNRQITRAGPTYMYALLCMRATRKKQAREKRERESECEGRGESPRVRER